MHKGQAYVDENLLIVDSETLNNADKYFGWANDGRIYYSYITYNLLHPLVAFSHLVMLCYVM